MVAAALVSHRSLPPVSLLLFLFLFSFFCLDPRSLYGCLVLSQSLCHSRLFLNSRTLQWAGMKGGSCALYPPELLEFSLYCFIPFFSLLLAFSILFFQWFLLISFFIFFASVPGICLEDYRCLFRFSLRTAEKDRKPDARMTCPDSVLCVRIWHKQEDTHSCTLIVFTVSACAIWPQTLFQRLNIVKKKTWTKWARCHQQHCDWQFREFYGCAHYQCSNLECIHVPMVPRLMSCQHLLTFQIT